MRPIALARVAGFGKQAAAADTLGVKTMPEPMPMQIAWLRKSW